MKRIIAAILSVCMIFLFSVRAEASEVQPRAVLNYTNQTLSSGEVKNLKNNGEAFYLAAGSYATIKYSASPSGTISVYFHNISTGEDTRVYSTYRPSSTVRGYFYLYNHSSSSVYVSNISIQF